MYGSRRLKIEDENGTWYFPFDGEPYRDALVSVKIDVGASTLWSEIQSVKTLDNLFTQQIITPLQYLQRLPKGTVPNISGLIREMQEANAAAREQAAMPMQPEADAAGMGAPADAPVDAQAVIDGLPPEYRQAFDAVPPEQQAALLKEIGIG